MPVTGFGLHGAWRRPFTTATRAEHAEDCRGGVRPGPRCAGVHLRQGRVYLSGAAHPATTHGSPRLAFTGWIDETSIADDVGNRDPLACMQAQFDRGGRAAPRRLRGDFVISHVAADGSHVTLYRAVTALTPVFGRMDADRFAWSSDPLDLLDDGPTLDDVELDLLPMVVSEMGMPESRSWFRGIHRLPAGHCLTLRAGCMGPTVERYDQLQPCATVPADLRDAASGLRQRLEMACDRMLSGESHALTLLSGGLDSAVVTREAATSTREVTGLHYTLGTFPGFDRDRVAVTTVAAECDAPIDVVDMAAHVGAGGDYLETTAGALPQTHVPQPGPNAAVNTATARSARFVLSGLLADQLMAVDPQLGRMRALGWSLLNPAAAGQPWWHLLGDAMADTSLRETGRRTAAARRLVTRLRGQDPVGALPHHEMIVHPIGLSRNAAERVAVGIRERAQRAARSFDGPAAHGASRNVTSAFYLSEALNTPNLQAAWLNHYLPAERIFATPFADRDVVEYGLGMAAHQRFGIGLGSEIDKLALRVAYADRLPAVVCRRMHQARIDAIPAVFVNQNVERIRRLLGDDSLLRATGVVSGSFADALRPRTVHRNGEKLARLCAIELWLKELAS